MLPATAYHPLKMSALHDGLTPANHTPVPPSPPKTVCSTRCVVVVVEVVVLVVLVVVVPFGVLPS